MRFASRRLVARVALAALALALVGTASCGDPGPPDLVLVTLDTTRADRLGPYGFAGARTPRLDAFAEEGIVYERAYATSPWTLPSHASLLTGLLPMQHGAQATAGGTVESLGYPVRPLAEHFDTLAERLGDAGYATLAVVAGPALSKDLGLDQGFDVYEASLSGPGETLTGRRAADVADLAIRAVEKAGGQPLFLFVNFFDPHAPYRPPPPHDRGLPPAESPELGGALLRRLEAGEPARPVAELPAREREALRAMLAGYDAEIAYMDHHLGRLLDAFASRGRPTLVVVTADHGESFGEHYFLSHGAHLYEDNVRVPLIVRHPDGAGAGTRVEAPIQNHRAFATLLEAAGLATPAELGLEPLSGRARPIVTEVRRSQANVRLFGSFFDRDLWAVQDDSDKLVTSSRGEAALYELLEDDGELRDRAAAAPERVRALHATLRAIQQARPPRFDPEARAELGAETEEALRALGYLE